MISNLDLDDVWKDTQRPHWPPSTALTIARQTMNKRHPKAASTKVISLHPSGDVHWGTYWGYEGLVITGSDSSDRPDFRLCLGN
ncbi:MAG: hypothetical protein F6K09_07500 [Merismopedia sp. SIO2A8]|nr:hypothetical protein [Merismopedia sp. SIO2A8]